MLTISCKWIFIDNQQSLIGLGIWPPPTITKSTYKLEGNELVDEADDFAKNDNNFYFKELMQYYCGMIKNIDKKLGAGGTTPYSENIMSDLGITPGQGGVKGISGIVLGDPSMPVNKHLRFCSVLEGIDGTGRYADTPEGDIDLGGMSFNPLQSPKVVQDIITNLKGKGFSFPETDEIGFIYESCFQRDPWNTIEGDATNPVRPLQARSTWGRPGVDRTNPGKNDMNIIDALNTIWGIISKNFEPARPADPSTYDAAKWDSQGWGGRQQNIMKETLLPWVITYYIRSFWDPSSPTYMPNTELGFTVNLQVKDRRWSYYGWQEENVKPGKSVFYGSAFSFAPPSGGKINYSSAFDFQIHIVPGPFDETITVGPHQYTDAMGGKIAITRGDDVDEDVKKQNLEALRLAAGCGVPATGAVMYSEPTAAGRLGGLKNPNVLDPTATSLPANPSAPGPDGNYRFCSTEMMPDLLGLNTGGKEDPATAADAGKDCFCTIPDADKILDPFSYAGQTVQRFYQDGKDYKPYQHKYPAQPELSQQPAWNKEYCNGPIPDDAPEWAKNPLPPFNIPNKNTFAMNDPNATLPSAKLLNKPGTVNPCNNMVQALRYIQDINEVLLSDEWCPWNVNKNVVTIAAMDTEGGTSGWGGSLPNCYRCPNTQAFNAQKDASGTLGEKGQNLGKVGLTANPTTDDTFPAFQGLSGSQYGNPTSTKSDDLTITNTQKVDNVVASFGYGAEKEPRQNDNLIAISGIENNPSIKAAIAAAKVQTPPPEGDGKQADIIKYMEWQYTLDYIGLEMMGILPTASNIGDGPDNNNEKQQKNYPLAYWLPAGPTGYNATRVQGGVTAASSPTTYGKNGVPDQASSIAKQCFDLYQWQWGGGITLPSTTPSIPLEQYTLREYRGYQGPYGSATKSPLFDPTATTNIDPNFYKYNSYYKANDTGPTDVTCLPTAWPVWIKGVAGSTDSKYGNEMEIPIWSTSAKPGSDYTGSSTGTGGVTFPNSYFTFGKDKDPIPWESQYLNQIISGSPSLIRTFTCQQDWDIFMAPSESNNKSPTMLSISKGVLYTGYEGMVLSGYPGSNRPAPMAIQTTTKDSSFWRDGRIVAYNRDLSTTSDPRSANFKGYYFVQRGFRTKMSNPDYLSSIINSFPLQLVKPQSSYADIDKNGIVLSSPTPQQTSQLFAFQHSMPRMNGQAGITGPQAVTPGIDDLSQYGNWPVKDKYPTLMGINNQETPFSSDFMKSVLFPATLKIGFTSSITLYNEGICKIIDNGCMLCGTGNEGSDIQRWNAVIPSPNYSWVSSNTGPPPATDTTLYPLYDADGNYNSPYRDKTPLPPGVFPTFGAKELYNLYSECDNKLFWGLDEGQGWQDLIEDYIDKDDKKVGSTCVLPPPPPKTSTTNWLSDNSNSLLVKYNSEIFPNPENQPQAINGYKFILRMEYKT